MFNITLKTLKSSLFSIFLLTLFSCSEDPTEPTDGVDGINGFNALVEVQNEDPGTNCSSGGVRISVGQDTNENGVLDESEIASISFVCNGGSGSDGTSAPNLAARTSPENPGVNCENGGTLVEIGTDVNENNALDDDEVQNSFYVCNGLDGADGSGAGANGLTSLIIATPLTDCGVGGTTGIRLEIGLDDNGNGSLDTEEIDTSYDLCDGADGVNTLLACTSESAGTNCENGGIRVEIGLDSNNNSVLDAEEVIGEPKYICNGVDGRSPIVTTTTDVACTNGGVELTIGFDNDGDGSIDEVLETVTICNGENGSNGANGYNSIIKTSASATCPNGGTLVQIGLDTDRSGTLEDEEVDSSFDVCNGATGSTGDDGRDIKMSSTSASCGGDGGYTYTFGYDNDGNGSIDEIITSFTVCNGSNGSDGSSDGVYELFIYNGLDGYDQTQDTYIDQNDQESNFDLSEMSVSAGDVSYKYGLLRFDGIENIVSKITDSYEILQTQIYLTGYYSSANENYVGVKALTTATAAFEQTKATYLTPDGNAEWSGGSTFDASKGDATGAFMDTHQLLPISYEGIVPLQISRSLVNDWIGSPSTNQGLVLEMVSTANTKQINFYDSENEDPYLRPVLYIKIQDLNATRGRSTTISDQEYKTRWNSMSFEEKIAPLTRRK